MTQVPEPETDEQLDAVLAAGRSVQASLIGLTILAGVFVLIAWRAQTSPFYLLSPTIIWVSTGLAGALLVASYIDIKSYILPDIITLPLILAGVVFHALMTGMWGVSALGVVFGYGLFAGLIWAWRTFRGKHALGLGDAKLIAAGGAFCTIWAMPMILMIAAMSALVFILVQRLVQRETGVSVVPFGPFLALGIWTAWSWPSLYLV